VFSGGVCSAEGGSEERNGNDALFVGHFASGPEIRYIIYREGTRSMKTEEIRIAGMSCNHCVMHVRKALEAVPGVTIEQLEIGKAVVRYDDSKTPHETLAAAVVKAGYSIMES
jgi:copper chaperone